MRKAMYLMGILADEDVEWLGKKGTATYMPPGRTLIQEGLPIEDLFILLDGKLSVMVRSLANREIASLLAGEIIGEISFVDSRVPSASVATVTDSHVLVVPRSVVTEKLKTDTAFAAHFYKALATLLADRLRKTVGHLGYGSWSEDDNADELDESLMDVASSGAVRFERLLKHLRTG